jgi:YD repeat-containing protein
MLAAKFFDGVIGIDIHWELVPAPPAPPIPTPFPNPFVGMIFDPLGLGVGLVISDVIGAVCGSPPTGPVVVNFLPAANTGTEVTGFGHILIPPGTSWAPMPSVKPPLKPDDVVEPDNPATPDNDGAIITGSKTVHVMGSNFSRLGDLVMTCSEPVRLPSSAVLATPKGMPVLIGGPPTIDFLAAAGQLLRSRWVSDQIHSLVSRFAPQRLRNLIHRAVCFLTGHPVDVATGRLLTDRVDFELPHPSLPLRFERVYSSGFASRSGPLGFGWSHSLDERIWLERGKAVYLAEDGRELEFETFDFPNHVMRPGDQVFDPIHRATLRCRPNGAWEVWTADGICRELAPIAGGDPSVARLVRRRTRDDHHRVELHYDARANLEWVRDAGGRQLRFEHDASGHLVRVKLPVARGEGHYEHARYTYDAAGDLAAVTDAAGKSWTFEYSTHLMTRETDRAGLSFYFGYDGIGEDAWCIRTWGDGGIYDHEIVYDKKGRATVVRNSLGDATIYKMNVLGLVTEVIDAHGKPTKYEYDERTLQRAKETDALGGVTRTTYDERGNRVRVEHADGAVATLESHPEFLDAPVRVIDPAGGEWQYAYDMFGRLTGKANPFGHWTRYEYERGLLRQTSSPGGAVTRFDYDEAAMLRRVVNATEAELRIEHDRLGRAVKFVTPRGGVERHEYDALGNLVGAELVMGVRWRFEYDAEQNRTRSSDAQRDISFTYTGYYRLHSRTEAGATMWLHYDTEDQLVAVENEAAERYVYERDRRGFVVAESGFDGSTRRWERDACGRATRLTMPSGRTREYRYDPLGRITDVAHSDGTFERYRYRADGLLTEASNQDAEVHLEMDACGRIVREVCRGGDGSEQWVRSGFGPDGHRVRVESSDGHLHHIERNLVGDVMHVELEHLRWRVDFERDAVGTETSRSFPNGVVGRWQRDVAGRPIRRTIVQGERTLSDRRYEWDGEIQLRALIDLERGTTPYAHDARGRLIGARLPWGEEQVRALDVVGNPYRSASGRDREYGPGGRIRRTESAEYRHDADGNVIEKSDVLGERTRYSWNGSAQLTSVILPDGREVRFTYDALSRRLSKTVSRVHDGAVTRTHWRWDAHVPITEIAGEGEETTWVFEPESFTPLAKLASGRVWGVLADQTGASAAT